MSDSEAASIASEQSEEAASGSASESDEESSPETHKREPAKDKKKKKKKKKKKSEGAPANQPAELSPAEKAEDDRRFNAAVKQCKHGDGDDIWVKLQQCHLRDSKARQISDALQKNSFVTSLDLSSNRITDAGTEALAAMLTAGGAPELIFLDLRGNALTDAGTQSMAKVMKSRKQLTVELGPSAAELAAQKAESTGPEGTDFEHAEVAGESEVVRRFFQSEGGSQQMGSQGSIPPEVEEDPQAAAVRLWKEVCNALHANPADIASMSGALRWISIGMTKELDKIREDAVHSLPIAIANTEVKPYYNNTLQHLQDLSAAIDHRGTPSVTTYSRDKPQETGGGHLPCSASLLSQLVACGLSDVDSQIVSLQFLPRLLSACLQYPCANALQVATVQLIRNCGDSASQDLLSPLVASPHEEKHNQHAERQAAPYHHQLMAIGKANQDNAIGLRSCHLAFAIQILQLLRQIQGGVSGDHQDLANTLKDDEAWMQYSGPDGVLQHLLDEQQDVLVGPRPEKPPPMSQSSMTEGGQSNGNVLPEQLIRFLQNMTSGSRF